MPLARIEIEQVEATRWVAEVEAGGLPGGPNFRREHFTARSLEDAIGQVTAAYAASQVVKTAKAAAAPVDMPPTRDELFAKAEALGLDPDRRWGEARLAREIADAEESRGNG